MSNTQVVGKALYLEFRRDGETNQVIMTPEAINAAGKYVPITTYRRRISSTSPRKTWKQMSTVFKSEIDPLTNKLVALGREHALATVPDRISYTDNLFSQLANAGWKLHKQPIAVEVTLEDLEDIRLSKTPYKILGRITRCRRALNFGEPLFAE
jgi:hypothetical protein